VEPTGSRVLLRRSDASWGAARGERPAPNASELDTARTFGEQAERRDAPARVGPVRSLWLRPHPQQRHRTLHADCGKCQGDWSEDGKKASWPKSGPLRRTGTSRRWQSPHSSDETANHRGAKGGRKMNTANEQTGLPTPSEVPAKATRNGSSREQEWGTLRLSHDSTMVWTERMHRGPRKGERRQAMAHAHRQSLRPEDSDVSVCIGNNKGPRRRY
jgi:hypothetical protein